MNQRSRTASTLTTAQTEECARTLDLHAGVGFLARLIDTRVRNVYEELTEQNEITPRQFGALLTLYQKGTMTLTELSINIYVDRSTLSEMINRMVKRKLVIKSANSEDERSAKVALSPSGKAILLGIVQGVVKQQQILLAPLPKSERAQFIRNMKLIAGMQTNGSTRQGED
jgi:DNA-binding MarR family transcriptional regulator